MKKSLLLFSLFSNFCLGQTTIEGKLTSLPNTSFSIKTDQSALNNYTGIVIGQGKTDERGQFNSTLNIYTEQPITMFIDKLFFTLWVKPHTILTVQEFSDGHYVFSGATNKENTFLYHFGLMQPYTVPSNVGINNFEPQRQLHYLDSIETKRRLTLTELSKGESLSQKFISYCSSEIRNFSLFNKNQYPALLKATNKISDNDIPTGYYNFWNKFSLEQDSTASNFYHNALQNFIEFKTAERIGKSQIGTEYGWRECFRTMDSLLPEHPLSLQKQKTAALLILIRYFNFPTITALEIGRYKDQFPSSASLPIINEQWQKKNVSAGVIPSFRLKNIEGNWVDIKDLRGKIVYIDFWGAWCKACLLNMPHSESLKKKYKHRDILFLYIDFYDTKEKWLNAINKYKIGGLHLKAEKSDEEYFNNIFNINQGFPRYALIDKLGKLITISAPPPQDQSVYDLIEKYLSMM